MSQRYYRFHILFPDGRTSYRNDRTSTSQETAELRLRSMFTEKLVILSAVHVEDVGRQKSLPVEDPGPKGVEGTPSGN